MTMSLSEKQSSLPGAQNALQAAAAIHHTHTKHIQPRPVREMRTIAMPWKFGSWAFGWRYDKSKKWNVLFIYDCQLLNIGPTKKQLHSIRRIYITRGLWWNALTVCLSFTILPIQPYGTVVCTLPERKQLRREIASLVSVFVSACYMVRIASEHFFHRIACNAEWVLATASWVEFLATACRKTPSLGSCEHLLAHIL